MPNTRPAAAVIGSGVAGLVAAHVLSFDHDVTLYEAASRLGGHADTHDVTIGGRTFGVDTGFIVHNERTYPTLLRLFADLGVETQESEMSMSVRDDLRGLEYAGALGPSGLFPRLANAKDPNYLRMLAEIPRFHRRAKEVLARHGERSVAAGPCEGPSEDETVADFVVRHRFSDYFRDEFLVPVIAAVWSCEAQAALDYPARYLFTFLEHHGMLGIFGSPTWRTVTGGSREYVRRVAKNLTEVLLDAPVSAVVETAEGVQITSRGQTRIFERAVIATHSDQALAMLTHPTSAQREILGAIEYTPNQAILHTDEALLPVNSRARGSWNFQHQADRTKPVLVTYDLSRLQRLDTGDTRVLVTLGGRDLIDPDKIIDVMEYAHPRYTPDSVAAQRRIEELNSPRLAFAGAWQGWGFHEDGALSGRRAAEHLGARWPELHRRPARTPAIYQTRIGHARTAPLKHSFTYRSHTWLVDVDELPRFSGLAAGLRVACGFFAKDHIGDPAASLRSNIEAVLGEHGVDLHGGPIQMLANPRVAGYVFNPISIFWCFGADRRLAAVVVEVHNTYGERHAYVVRTDPAGRAAVAKHLYVSPFNDTSGRYEISAPIPGDRLAVTVTLHRPGQPPFVATMSGRATAATPAAVLRATARQPLAPMLTSLRIRRHGIALWLRRLPIQPRPKEKSTR